MEAFVKAMDYQDYLSHQLNEVCCGLSRKESILAAQNVGKLIDYAKLIYRKSKTSRTSQKAFIIKSLYVERWINYRRGYPLRELLERFPGDEAYVLRQIKRSEKANRVAVINGVIEPTRDTLEDLQAVATEADLGCEVVQDAYLFNYRSSIAWLLSRLVEQSLEGNDHSTFLSFMVELTIWEANLAHFSPVQVTSSDIAERLEISKSTLSCLLSTMETSAITTLTDPNDQRKVTWHLSSHLNIKLKSDLIKYASSSKFKLLPLKAIDH